MTLVVGIQCSDGVVIGTDSAMTFGIAEQFHTIEQPIRRKIDIIEDKIIIAGTGQIGLGQRFTELTERLWKGKKFSDKSILDIGRLISHHTIQDFQSTFLKPGAFGALTAIPNKSKAELIEFAVADFQPEVKSEINWYASMGSGQPVADPLLGFVRTVFWGDDAPSCKEGIFATTLVLKLACSMTPHGVAGPIQMATLCREKREFTARYLTEDELHEHDQSVDEAISHFKDFRAKLAGSDFSESGIPAAPMK